MTIVYNWRQWAQEDNAKLLQILKKIRTAIECQYGTLRLYAEYHFGYSWWEENKTNIVSLFYFFSRPKNIEDYDIIEFFIAPFCKDLGFETSQIDIYSGTVSVPVQVEFSDLYNLSKKYDLEMYTLSDIVSMMIMDAQTKK
jgi:hypothetical protein